MDKTDRELTISLWSDDTADYRYKLSTYKYYASSNKRYLHSLNFGNSKWAERIAAHYGLDMPTEPEDAKSIKVTVDGGNNEAEDDKNN